MKGPRMPVRKPIANHLPTGRCFVLAIQAVAMAHMTQRIRTSTTHLLMNRALVPLYMGAAVGQAIGTLHERLALAMGEKS